MKKVFPLFVVTFILAGVVVLFKSEYRSQVAPLMGAKTIPEHTISSEEQEAYQNQLPEYLVDPRIVIHKKERRVRLYDGDKLLRVYVAGLGFNPIGDKEKEGDGKTPEGDFYICVKNPNSKFYLSLGISYPMADDAERGFRDGLIDKNQAEQIKEAVKTKRRPVWDTLLGGEVFIHGHGSRSDWTLGCVALDNEDMKELYDVIRVGTPVRILP